MLTYQEFEPAEELRAYLECYCVLQSESGLDREICLPDGSASLLFNFRNPIQRAYCHRPKATEKIGYASALHQGKQSTIVTHPGPLYLLGVRFRPHGFSAFFNTSMAVHCPPFAIQELALSKLIGTLGADLHHEPLFSAQREMLDFRLGKLLAGAAPVDGMVGQAVSEMLRCSGNLRIGELHEQLWVSKSTLEKKFQEHVGLSPKNLCNVFRFNSIIYQGHQVPAPSLTQLTYDQGFFDQSHLVHNFRSFTGLPPGRFFRQKHPLVEMLRQSFEARAKNMC